MGASGTLPGGADSISRFSLAAHSTEPSRIRLYFVTVRDKQFKMLQRVHLEECKRQVKFMEKCG